MPEELKSLVLQTIHNIYPWIEADIMLLSGSRALWVAQNTSDIDIVVFTTPERYLQYKKISIEKWYRTDNEDPWFEFNIDYQDLTICLEVKFMTELYFANLIDYHSLLNTLCINEDSSKDIELKKQMRQRFDTHYEKYLMKWYIQFFQDFKDMKWLFEKEKTDIRDQSIFIKKWMVLESFLKLIYLIQKEWYPTVKWLITLLEWGIWDWAKDIVARVISLQEYTDLLLLETEIKDIINKQYMPPKPYVGARRKFLKEFKKN